MDAMVEKMEEYSEGMERMQLNPSTDFYDEDFTTNYHAIKKSEDNNDDVDDDDVDDDDEVDDYEDNDDYDEENVDFYKNKKVNKDFMNEQGSGDGTRSTLSSYRSDLSKSRFYLEYLEKDKGKKEKKTFEYDITDRDENDDVKNDSTIQKEGSGGNLSDDDEDIDDDDRFFSTKLKSNSRYFRKNTNDAIKIISTPIGKVGIVYQQTSDENKKSNVDFDSFISHENSHSRSSLANPKITPVLTADGKVALLYRGDSENTKYEPILNITNKFNMDDNKTNNTDPKIGQTTDNILSKETFDDNDDKGFYDEASNKKIKDENVDLFKKQVYEKDSLSTTTDNLIKNDIAIENDNSVLPIINRPLSEVLGIKKNQFKQFRIKDTPSTIQPDSKESIQTTVNLGEYSHQNRNYDFDFGLDRTMLDERNNQQNHFRAPTNKIKHDYANSRKIPVSSNVATDDLLSKTEVVNLAIIPHFDEEFEQQQHLREHETNGRIHKQRNRYRQFNEDLSGIHCVMQAMMAIAAISAVFGMLGAFFKQRILDQIRMMQW